MIYLFIIICVCVYMFAPDALAYGVTDTSLWNAFLYPFAHAGWKHLLINSLSLLIMFNPIYRLYVRRFESGNSILFFFSCYIGAVLAGLWTATDVPTVGSSGIVFFLLGVLLMLQPTMRQLQNFIFVALAVIIQIIRGKSNVALHIVAFVFGCLYIIITILSKKEYLKKTDLD